MSCLKKEKLVLSLYYTDELTMKETGEVIGVTESRVSRASLSSDHPTPFQAEKEKTDRQLNRRL